MSSGPSEMILLSAGLIVAALVSGVLLDTWSDMDDALDDRGKQEAEDIKTRASLANDPINIDWEAGEEASIWLQNSGDTCLDINGGGVLLHGSSMTVSVADGSTQWLPGDVVKFTIDGTNSGLTFSSGNHDVKLSATVTSTATNYAGMSTFTEEVRIGAP